VRNNSCTFHSCPDGAKAHLRELLVATNQHLRTQPCLHCYLAARKPDLRELLVAQSDDCQNMRNGLLPLLLDGAKAHS